MGLRINTNVAAINARRNLTVNEAGLRRSIARLASGARVTSAGDDAAGLAITNRFTARIRGLNQAVRNTNDGLSLVQTAEGALQETSNLVQRMRELAVQAANDTNTANDRAALQDEVDQLIDEVDRIAQTTRFNNLRLLDGTFVGSRVHVGAGSSEIIDLQLDDAGSRSLGRQVREAGAAVSLSVDYAAGTTLNGVALRATELTDDGVSAYQPQRSAIAKAAVINGVSHLTGVRAIVNETVFDGIASKAPAGGVLGGDHFLTINNHVVIGVTVQANDADGSLVEAINALTEETGVIASKAADNRIVLTAPDDRNIGVRPSTNTAALRTGLRGGGGLEVDAASITLQSTGEVELVLPNAASASALGFGAGAGTLLFGINDRASVFTVDVRTRAGANRAIEIADVALGQVGTSRANLGAIQNRLESTLQNLQNNAENLSAARSRILDADFASETAVFARNKILQQAGVSVLAQANTQGRAALDLLAFEAA